jgi:hypothetical protein
MEKTFKTLVDSLLMNTSLIDKKVREREYGGFPISYCQKCGVFSYPGSKEDICISVTGNGYAHSNQTNQKKENECGGLVLRAWAKKIKLPHCPSCDCKSAYLVEYY